MGTHPIFESDFDCLTEQWVILTYSACAFRFPPVRTSSLTAKTRPTAPSRLEDQKSDFCQRHTKLFMILSWKDMTVTDEADGVRDVVLDMMDDMAALEEMHHEMEQLNKTSAYLWDQANQ